MFYKVFLILSLSTWLAVNCNLSEFYKWKQVNFVTGSKEAVVGAASDKIIFRDHQLRNKTNIPKPRADEIDPDFVIIPENNLPMGVNHHNGRVFVTLPRRRPGVPATLTYIKTSETEENEISPSVRPYPDYATNSLHPQLESDDSRIVSVYRTEIDACKRMWFIDTGLLEYPNNNTQVQRPSIWVIDLLTDKMVKRFPIPDNFVMNGLAAGLANIAVDVTADDCDNAFAYIPDLLNYRLYVYSFKDDRIWTFQHNYFSFDPLHGDFNVNGIEFQWNDGIFSITLGNLNEDGYRTAYFHAMASIYEYTVSTSVLRNESLSTGNHHMLFKCLGPRGPRSQTSSHAFDKKTGIIFFAEVGSNSITCWNSKKPYTTENFGVVAHNNDTMIYPSDLNIDDEGNLWVMTNTLPYFIYTSLNGEEYNFKIWQETTTNAVKGTPCEIPSLPVEVTTLRYFNINSEDDEESIIFN